MLRLLQNRGLAHARQRTSGIVSRYLSSSPPPPPSTRATTVESSISQKIAKETGGQQPKRSDAQNSDPGNAFSSLGMSLNTPLTGKRSVIDGIGPTTFTINGVRVRGSVLIMPLYSTLWNVDSWDDLCPEAFTLLKLSLPKPDILILGCGATALGYCVKLMPKAIRFQYLIRPATNPGSSSGVTPKMNPTCVERIQRILDASSHPTRNLEHAIYVRLLKRSRNQHRHGLYFRRLQHVQRVLRDVNDHPVWNSLQTSTDLATICSVLGTLVELLKELVETIIPKAAHAIVVHLVMLGQFIPFSVTICACLARLFQMERTLFNQLRILLRDVNVLLAGKTLDSSTNYADEDVGVALSDEDDDVMYERLIDQHTIEDRHVDSVIQNETSSLVTKSEEIKSSKQKNSKPPTLYGVLAQSGVKQEVLHSLTENADAIHSKAVMQIADKGKVVSASKNNASRGRKRRKQRPSAVGGNDKRQKTDLEPSNQTQSHPSPTPKSKERTPLSVKKSTPSVETDVQVDNSSKEIDPSYSDQRVKNANREATKRCINDKESSSESEDMDDIFGELE